MADQEFDFNRVIDISSTSTLEIGAKDYNDIVIYEGYAPDAEISERFTIIDL